MNYTDINFILFIAALVLIAYLFGRLNTLKSENSRIQRELQNELSKQTICDIVEFPVWERDKNGNITFSNKSYNKIISLNENDISIVEPVELFHNSNIIAQSAITNSSTEIHKAHVIVNGERKLFSITEIPNDNGTVGYAFDITELEDVQKELKRHLSVQSDLLESSNSAIAIFGADQRLKFFNNAFCKFWDLKENLLLNEPNYGELLDILRDKRKLPEQANFQEFKKECLEMFTNLIEKKEDFYFLPDGTCLRQIVIPHEHGGLLISYEDLTEQMSKEQSYKTLVDVKKSTIDNLFEGVVVFGEDGRIQLCNSVYLKMWNLNENIIENKPHINEILEDTIELYDYDEDWDEYKSNIISIINSRLATKLKIKRKDGSILELSCAPLPDGAILMLYMDVTDSVRLEKSLRAEKKALEEADHIKSNLLTNISYELRSPLTSLKGFSEGLLLGYFGEVNSEQKEYIKNIYDSSVSLSYIIDDIIDVTTIDSGYMKLGISDFSIKSLVENIESSFSKIIENKLHSLSITYPKNIGKMSGDQKRIEQIFLNILKNIVNLSEGNDNILISIKKDRPNNIVTFSIEDNNKGIEVIKNNRFFEKNHKTNIALSSYNNIGIILAKSFLDMHNAKVDIVNEEDKYFIKIYFAITNE